MGGPLAGAGGWITKEVGGMLTRRSVLRTLGAAGLSAAVGPGLLRVPVARAQVPDLPAGVVFDPAPFTLGVASGYPTTASVTLWTRLAPEPLAPDGGLQAPVDVRWVVAGDPGSAAAALAGAPSGGVVASGSTVAVAESGHSVHVDVGGLAAGQTYFYGFAALGASSVIGRTRTAPAAPTPHLRFAVASCQNFSEGFFAALGHIADEDVDFVLHAGDYTYEGGGANVRAHIGPAPVTPEEFRVRHALYKGDPNLRRAHALHPWIMTWDDHEVRNNYAGVNRPANADVLRAGAYKAYYEHLPIRLTEEGPPNGSSFRIYQQVVFGDLLDVALTDTRQYRDVQPCQGEELPCFSTHAYAPGRTLLGAQQKAWLKDLMTTSTAAWRVIATSVPFTQWEIGGLPEAFNDALNATGTPVNDKVYFNEDTWDSYNFERRELLQFLVDEGVRDVVSLTGESHRYFWSNIHLDVDDPASPVVLPEFGGTAISSNNGDPENDYRPAVYATSTHIRYNDSDCWGYMVCDVTPERWRTTARMLQHSQDPTLESRRDPNATVVDAAVFDVVRGAPELVHVAGDDTNPFPDGVAVAAQGAAPA